MHDVLPSYTEAELRSPNGPHLPGLWTPAKIDVADPYAFFRNTDWQPVLNLAIVTETIGETLTPGYGILTGSRPETELTHPSVVSTPTQWITDHVTLQSTLEDYFFNNGGATVQGLPATPEMHLQAINPNHYAVVGNADPRRANLRRPRPLVQLTQKLLAEKLGFDSWYGPGNKEQLAAAGLHPSLGTVSISRLLAGFSYVGENQHGEPLHQPLVMVGAVLHTPFPKLFPRSTPRYDDLTFTDLASFKGNVASRNVGNLIKLDTEADAVMMCVRGLCLTTGVEMASGPDLIAHADGFPFGEIYDPTRAAALAGLLAERDERGEKVAAEVNAILGRQALSADRVAFERVPLHSQEFV
jgi:hypothetical protein